MTSKFPFKFNLILSILIVLAGVLSAVMLVFNIYQLNDPSSNVKQSVQIVYVVVSAVFLAAVLLVLIFSKYRVSKNVIRVTIAFIPVVSIPFSSIAKFILFPRAEEFFIIYQKNDELKKHMICLSGAEAGRLMDTVSAVYPDIIREKIADDSEEDKNGGK